MIPHLGNYFLLYNVLIIEIMAKRAKISPKLQWTGIILRRMLQYMLNLYFSLVTNTWGSYLHKQVWFVLCPLLAGIEEQIKTFFKACLQSHIKLFWGHLRKQMTHLLLTFYFLHLWTCARQLLNLLLFPHHFSHVRAAPPDQLSAFDEMSVSQTNTNQGNGSSN